MPATPMRDPSRIDSVLTELRTAWSSNPDLRFFQLLSAIRPAVGTVDQFYEEDDSILEDLRRFNASE